MKKLYSYVFWGTSLLSFGTASAQEMMKTADLDEVNVKARRQIKTDSISNTLKTGGKLIELPQNIVSINNNLLQLQGAFEAQDVIRNVSGVYNMGSAQANVFSGMGEVSVRGFQAVNLYRNGMLSAGAQVSQEDIALIEQVDVIKGPAGFVNSMGPAGGSLSVSTKVPRRNGLLDATVTAGSYNFYRAAVDVGSAVRQKGFSYRFNTAYETREYYFDYTKRNKFVVAPVLQYNFSKRTYLLAEWNMTNGRAHNGSQFGKAGNESTVQKEPWSSNYMADPGLPVSKADDQYGRLVFSHEFNDNWKITSQSAIQRSSLDQWTFYNGTGYTAIQFDSNGYTTRRSFDYQRTFVSRSSQLFINGKYNINSYTVHKLLAGVDWHENTSDTYQGVGRIKFPFYRDKPSYGLNTDSLRAMSANPPTYYTKNMIIAGYVYNTFIFYDKLFFTLGARYTWNDRTSHSATKPDDVVYSFHSFNPRIGATFLIQPDFALFANYDQSFEPLTGVDKNGDQYKPQQSYNSEIGLKKQWFKGLLSTTLSGYIIKRNNMLLFDPVEVAARQVGQVRNRGIELDIIGNPVKNILVSANYSLMSSITSKDQFKPENVGKPYSLTPRQQINTWVMYMFYKGRLKGFSIAAGQVTALDRITSATNYNLPGYIKLDATLMYQHGRWYVRGILDNLTNKRYITSATVTDRLSNGSIVGQTWSYQESMPFNFKVQVGIKLK